MATEQKFDTRTIPAKKQEVVATFGAFDEDDPRALVNIAPPKVRQAILDFMNPDKPGNFNWLSWSENRLEMELRRQKAQLAGVELKRYMLDPVDQSLRLNFWNEYYRAQDTGKGMKDQSILRGICCGNDWWRRLQLPIFVAWLISAPRSLAVQQEEVLYMANKLLRKVVTDPNVIYEVKETVTINKDGEETRTKSKKLNNQAIAQVRKIAEDLSNRTQGSVVQKHMIAAHVAQNIPQIPTSPTQRLPQAESREDLEKEIQELENAVDESVLEGEFDETEGPEP